ncbi:WAP four-disulfide core domain protein 3 [Sarcoramphus papa]
MTACSSPAGTQWCEAWRVLLLPCPGRGERSPWPPPPCCAALVPGLGLRGSPCAPACGVSQLRGLRGLRGPGPAARRARSRRSIPGGGRQRRLLLPRAGAGAGARAPGLYLSGRGRRGGSAMMPGLVLVLLVLLAPSAPPGHCQLASGRRLIGKYGECPPPRRIPLKPCDSLCSSDADCPGSERCCRTSCGRECRLPTGAKRGFCPRGDHIWMAVCLVKCGSDSECQGSEKCCSIGCQVRCMELVPAKPGVCPKRKVLQTFAPCNSSCSDDTDCPRHEKCCFTGCGRGCLPPDRGTAAPLLPAGWGHRLGPAASNGPMSSGDICHLPPVTGPCRGRFRHYAYNPATGTCQPFIYSGCGGNPNNFITVEECQQVCQQPGRAKE